MKKKKSHGWVIQNRKTKLFYGAFDTTNVTYKLRNATVFRTRLVARSAIFYPTEMVHKVSLYKNGKPKKIIGKG